jgi:hypothetical protein
MPSSPWPDGQVSPALDQINKLIRRLMRNPAGKKRAADYERLLVLWAEVSREDAPSDEIEPVA